MQHFIAIFNQGISGKKLSVKIPYTTNAHKLSKLFYEIGYINYYVIIEYNTKIEIYFAYYEGKSIVQKLLPISKPSHRRSANLLLLRKTFYKQHKNFLISTSKGFMLSEEAIKTKIGGEILLMIY